MSRRTLQMKRFAAEAAKLLGLGGLLVLVMLWLSGAFVAKIQPGPLLSRSRPAAPRTQRATSESFPMVVEQVGTIQTRVQAQVSSRVMAQVREILVRDGQAVVGPDGHSEKSPATVLARLDDGEIKARLNQAHAQVKATEAAVSAAESQLAVAQAELESAQAKAAQVLADWHRYENLYKRQAATGQQLDRARALNEEAQARVQAARQNATASQKEIERLKAQKAASQASLNQAQVMLSYTVIMAPFNGTMIRKWVEIGDMVSPGQKMFLLESSQEPELHAVVAESLVGHLKAGTALSVYVDALGRSFPGTVRDVVRQASPPTRTVIVKVSLPANPTFFSGMAGHIEVTVGHYEALVIPLSSVSEVGQLHLVHTLSAEGYIHRRFVTLGKRHAHKVEVLSGLKAGEEVVTP